MVLIGTFGTNILYCHDYNINGCCSRSFNFCYDYLIRVSGGRESTFRISNKMPKFCYQYYLTLLKDLTSAKKVVIARAYPVVIILILKHNNGLNLRTYRGICRYFEFLLQNLGLLLILLPLEITSVDDILRIMWVDKLLSQPKQLSRFVNIQKYCVIGALQWLVANNLLYENI